MLTDPCRIKSTSQTGFLIANQVLGPLVPTGGSGRIANTCKENLVENLEHGVELIEANAKNILYRLTGICFVGSVTQENSGAVNIVHRAYLKNGWTVELRTITMISSDGCRIELYGSLEEAVNELECLESLNLLRFDEGDEPEVIDAVLSASGQNLKFGIEWENINDETYGIHVWFTEGGQHPSTSPNWLWLLTYITVTDEHGKVYSNIEESDFEDLLKFAARYELVPAAA